MRLQTPSQRKGLWEARKEGALIEGRGYGSFGFVFVLF